MLGQERRGWDFSTRESNWRPPLFVGHAFGSNPAPATTIAGQGQSRQRMPSCGCGGGAPRQPESCGWYVFRWVGSRGQEWRTGELFRTSRPPPTGAQIGYSRAPSTCGPPDTACYIVWRPARFSRRTRPPRTSDFAARATWRVDHPAGTSRTGTASGHRCLQRWRAYTCWT